jgi:hypothetical protein
VDPQVSAEVKQNRTTEFMRLLPLALELAGLPKGDPARPFTADQIEGRAMTVRTAYRAARALVKDVAENGA